MPRGLSGNQDDTFSTMGDDALESRFSTESIQVFHKSVADFESALPVRSYDIPVHFFGSFDTKSKNAIQNLVNESFVNAERHQLRLEHNKPEVSFYTPSSWKSSSGPSLKKNSPLPAARLTWNDGTPMAELIIPEKVTTSEDVIKTVRLLFSKLFGKLFFDEHVPRKAAFQTMGNNSATPSFDLREQAHLIHFKAAFTEPLFKAFDQAGQSLQIRGPKRREIGQKEFFNQLFREDVKVDEKVEKLVIDAFGKQLEVLSADPDSFFDDLANRFLSANPQTTAILPYDVKNFRSLADNRQWTIFHAFEERFQLIVNSMDELTECRAYLEQANSSETPEIDVLEGWKSTFSERIKVLKQRGYVKPFLIEGAKLSEKQQVSLAQFPLWIWQHCKPDSSHGGKSMAAFVAKVTDQYRNSVYQKLFEAAVRLFTCLDAILAGTHQSFADCADFQRIKTIIAWLDLRKTAYIDMLFTSKVASQFGELAAKRKVGKQQAIRNFEQGWSYFVSFAMVHQYFIELKKRSRQSTDRSGPFYTLIEKFVQARIASQPSFQISGLLLEFYRKRKFNLKKVSALIRKESQILDFFILNQPDIFRDQSKSPAEKIDHYAESLLQWQDKRDEQEILQEELESVRQADSR